MDTQPSYKYIAPVSTLGEIEAALSKLTTEELARVEQAIHAQYRQRGLGIICDDSDGVVTEADLVASADEAFQGYDRAEAADAKRLRR